MRLSSALTALASSASLLTATLVGAAPATAESAVGTSVARDPEDVVTVAHRGARVVAPENTLVALDAAADQGVDFVEVDVQRTKDGRLVLLHDNDLLRTTDVEKVFPKRSSYAVGDFTYRDIKRLDAGSWKAKRYAGVRIPTLKQAVRLLQERQVGIIIELKTPQLYPGMVYQVSAALHDVDGFLKRAVRKDRLIVQSFDLEAARTFSEIEPRVKVALLGTPDVAILPELAHWVDEISSFHRTVDATYVAAVHAVGMDSSVWTVNRVPDVTANLDKGVDGVVTNRPNMLGRVLQARATAS